MKLLANYTTNKNFSKKVPSMVEVWRISRPTEALIKNTDWDIKETYGIFPNKKISNVDEKELQERIDFFKDYDVVWSSYYTNAFIHVFTIIAQQKIKTKFVLDIDDNIFNIDKNNPIHIALDKKYINAIKGIVVDAKYITTTTETLADELRKYRYYREPESVVVIPNLITAEKYIPWKGNNKDKIVIGYAGGASHYDDLHKTGVYDALVKIMHEYKNVHVVTAGMFFDEYLPKARYKFIAGKEGLDNWYKIYNELNFDIAIAPLEDTDFTNCKSNIKWQEYSLMGIPTIASNNGPYKESIKHASTGYLVENTMDDWYKAFKLMIENESFRRKIGEKAKQDVINNHSIEKNWHKIKDGLEQINSLDIKD